MMRIARKVSLVIQTIGGRTMSAVGLGVVVLQVTGCGYAFRGSGSVLPPDIKVVSIPLVENSSTESGITSSFTEALRDEFERYGVVSVVDDGQSADAVLSARVLQVKRGSGSVSSNTDSDVEQDTTMRVAAELRRTNGAVVWRNTDIAISRSIGVTGSSVVTSSVDFSGGSLGAGDLAGLDAREVSRGQEQQALQNIVEQAARTIYDQAVAPDF